MASTDLKPARHPRLPPRRAVAVRVLLWRTRRIRAVLLLVLVGLALARQAAPPPPVSVPVVVAARDLDAGSALDAADLRVAHVPAGLAPQAAHADVQALVGRTVAVAVPRGLPLVDASLAGDRFAVDAPEGTVVVPVQVGAGAVTGLLRPGDRVDLVSTAVPDLWTSGCAGTFPGGAESDEAGDGGAETDEAGDGEHDPGEAGADESTEDGSARQEQAAADASGAGCPAPEPEVLARDAVVLEVRSGAAQDGGLSLTSGGATDPLLLVGVTPDDGARLASLAGSGAVGVVLVQ
ncbi:SAF domain-containing protein [Actinotalea subterranea]|uniref:SAF domain-containing protein n=1 Tax=Actinotalea subterranea TaxID=2607497 RepID=UPI0011EFFCCE|nr:SAF domain-containing protein [Actinotalea subterranea]